MSSGNGRNLLLVSNYPSDTSYAWWLMEHFWATIANHFSTPDRTVYLAYPEVRNVSKSIANAPIEVIELTIPWKTSAQYSLARRFIHEKKISFIYFTDQHYFNYQYAMMRYHGVQQIVVHDHTPGDRPALNGFKGTLKATRNMLTWMTADKVLCVSPHMLKRNVTNSRIPEHKCLVVQNGIQPVNCKQHTSATTRESCGFNNKSLLVVTTGRASPYKRFDFIIESAKQLKILLPESDIIFLLIGDGPAIPRLKKQISNNNLEDTVKLLGFRDDIRQILCASDIAIHAAMGEGFSLSIIEYMSAGLPVLVPDIPSVSQAITHTKTGLIYRHDDPKEAATYLAQLASNKTQRLAMGAAAKTEADEKYSLKRCTGTLLATLKQSILSES